MKNQHPNCMQCKHYMVTWDQNAPRGCRLYDFKSQSMPSTIVWQSSGSPCGDFDQKVKLDKKKSGELDLFSDDLW